MTSVLAMWLVFAQVSPGTDADPWDETATKPKEKPSAYRRDLSPATLGYAAGASAAAIGLGVCSWVGREGSAGFGCAIAAGALGLAALFAAFPMAGVLQADWTRLGDSLFGAVLFVPLAFVAGLVGAVLGGVVAGFAGSEPGVPRGVTGVVGSGLLLTSGLVTSFVLVRL